MWTEQVRQVALFMECLVQLKVKEGDALPIVEFCPDFLVVTYDIDGLIDLLHVDHVWAFLGFSVFPEEIQSAGPEGVADTAHCLRDWKLADAKLSIYEKNVRILNNTSHIGVVQLELILR